MIYSYAEWEHAQEKVALIYRKSSARGAITSYFVNYNNESDPKFNDSGQEFNKISEALQVALNSDAKIAFVVLNEGCVISTNILEQWCAAPKTNNVADVNDWLLAAPAGLTTSGQVSISSYFQDTPELPDNQGVQPASDIFTDSYAINLDTCRKMQGQYSELGNHAFELGLILLGNQSGLTSFIAPLLSCAVDGAALTSDYTQKVSELQKLNENFQFSEFVPSLLGPLCLTGSLQSESDIPAYDMASVTRYTKPAPGDAPALSIVVRTCFNRPALLKRFFASVLRAALDDFPIEIILSFDIELEKAKAELSAISENLDSLPIQLKYNEPNSQFSRVRNLLGGMNSARGEFIWVVDDDDYIAPNAFNQLRQIISTSPQSMIYCNSTAVEEKWEFSENRAVLAQSTELRTYLGSDWHRVFEGLNQTPICSFIAPRNYLHQRLAEIPLNYNLSEDFAIILALLGSTSLPTVAVLNETLVYISIRDEGDNTVNMKDRRPWAQDTHGFLNELILQEQVASRGFWQLMKTLVATDANAHNKRNQDLIKAVQGLHERNRDLKKTVLLLEKRLTEEKVANTVYIREEKRAEPPAPPTLVPESDQPKVSIASRFLGSR